MSAAHVSAAALTATARAIERPRPRHCPDAQDVEYLRGLDLHPQYLGQRLRAYRAFRDHWPSLPDWFAEPLVNRVGRLPGESNLAPSYPVSFRAPAAARLEVERTLAADAAERGWEREVERHRCVGERIEKLLVELGQPLDESPESSGE